MTTSGASGESGSGPSRPMTAEHARLAEATGRAETDLFTANPWYEWGPYLSERAWGTVREDYSADGDAWRSFPHDHARSRAYRWNEDGMAGISDIRHELCLGLALWNGKDPILKERIQPGTALSLGGCRSWGGLTAEPPHPVGGMSIVEEPGHARIAALAKPTGTSPQRQTQRLARVPTKPPR